MLRIFLTASILFVGSLASAADWPQFRGLNGTGTSDEKGLPELVDKPESIKWQVDLPGRGVSSPVIVGGKIFITCSDGKRDDRLHTVAFDGATGKQLWHRTLISTGITAAHPKTAMAAPTPVADAKAVYALFATGDLACYSHDGLLLWYRSLTGDYPSISNVVGMASSPVLVKDKLIVPMDNSGDSFIAALDVKTGTNVWKEPRPRESCWITPTVRELTSEDTEVLCQNIKELAAYDLRTGKKKWSEKLPGQVPMLTVSEGMMMVASGGVKMLKPAAEGKFDEVWKSAKLQTGYSTPLLYDGQVFAANPAGVVYCADAKTGKPVWEERIKGAKQTFSSSPIAGDGKVYVVTETGTLCVFKSGAKEADLLSSVELKQTCLATPALSNGKLYVRAETKLICIGK